jgi:nucleoside-diphosphate-sugar epimerase
MRVLVTGATGFLGSYVTETLLAHGETVAVLHRPATDCWRIAHLLPRVRAIAGDLRELPAVADQIQAFKPDTVIHLAWQGVGNAYRNDPIQIDHNLQSSLDLFRLAAACGCRTWVGLGSQAEYGPQNHCLSETDPDQPTTLYGSVKVAVRGITAQLAALGDVRFAWLRLFSPYGPRDNEGWLIPYVIRSLQRREPPALTAAEQQWDYLYVADAAEAVYRVAATPTASGIFNLGSGQAVRLRDLIEQLRDLLDPGVPLHFGAVPYRPDQVMYLQAAMARLEHATGWQPTTDLATGLRQTVAWYQAHPL